MLSDLDLQNQIHEMTYGCTFEDLRGLGLSADQSKAILDYTESGVFNKDILLQSYTKLDDYRSLRTGKRTY